VAERRLADHTPYKGVELTVVGRRLAVGAIRRHRVVERFLSDMLGYAWNEADRLAPVFEHDLPEEVLERLFVALHRPTTCPHGFPIPEPGDVAVVAVPGSTDQALVDFLETLGLRPGVSVEVREKHPFDGPLVLAVAGCDRTISQRIAQQIFVHPAAPLAAPDTPQQERTA
jgi:DtxR family Mn-dependent transcriptional regulator